MMSAPTLYPPGGLGAPKDRHTHADDDNGLPAGFGPDSNDNRILATALVLAAGIVGVVYLRARYRRLGYLLRQHDISVRRGVLVVSVQTVPFGRVQNVRVDRGPLDRAVGLASLTVTSAGGSLAVPGLPVEIAEALKETVVARAGLDQGETHNGER